VIGAQPVSIVGAGPTGALLAIFLKRRGLSVTLYDSRPELEPSGAGRSINLALAARGIHALRQAGVYDAIAAAAIPMRGRMIHDLGGKTQFQPYGQRPAEFLLSLSRSRLNRVLLDVARHDLGVPVHFEHRLESADFAAGTATLGDAQGRRIELPMQPLLASDGAGSRMRRCLAEQTLSAAAEIDLDHGYKELSIPAGSRGEYRLEREALHIWPRGDYMLIALPNADGSFTATLFLPKAGAVSFASLNHAAAIEEFLQWNFADACALMPRRVEEFLSHATGFLGTVHATPWHHGGMTTLIGDAAHAIVPFHGQGMNCCFEDCLEFDAGLERHDSWQALFADFEARRRPNTDAIATMALENYLEMRERVADPRFHLQQSLALELERRHPQRFIPRYSMVTFHHEIPYRVAQQRGAVQARMLEELTMGCTSLADVDFARAARQIDARLPDLAPDLAQGIGQEIGQEIGQDSASNG
jgi:kynurenine 3-monooxygenase